MYGQSQSLSPNHATPIGFKIISTHKNHSSWQISHSQTHFLAYLILRLTNCMSWTNLWQVLSSLQSCRGLHLAGIRYQNNFHLSETFVNFVLDNFLRLNAIDVLEPIGFLHELPRFLHCIVNSSVLLLYCDSLQAFQGLILSCGTSFHLPLVYFNRFFHFFVVFTSLQFFRSFQRLTSS